MSFTKSLAKLGSDLKKPDAITVLDYDTYKEKIYDLPVNMLLYVGKNTNDKLKKLGIKTIGDLALSNKYRIIKHLGKLGEQIYNYANGIDNDPVKFYYEKDERKSVSKGITFEEDITDIISLKNEFSKLASSVSFSLREIDMKANVVSITLKDATFSSIVRQKKIEYTCAYDEIYKEVNSLLTENYINGKPIRYICVGVSGLKGKDDNEQLSLFSIVNEDKTVINNMQKKEKATKAMDSLKKIYGDKIDFASTIETKKD